jgi:hypothetical protein
VALVYLLALGVLAGGVWGLLVPRGHQHEHAGAAVRTVDLADGTLRVDGVVDNQVGHAMPGMGVVDSPAEGMRRFSVNVSLGAAEGRTLAYDRRDFAVAGPGTRAVAPLTGQIDRGVLTAGRAISGSLTFEVPADAVSLSLRFGDTEPVALPDLPPVESDHASMSHPSSSTAGAPAGEHDAGAREPEHDEVPGHHH